MGISPKKGCCNLFIYKHLQALNSLKLVNQGLKMNEVLITGVSLRIRPVLMTAFTTMFGLIPLLVALGPGAEIQRPLATVVVGGLFTSTLITLFVLPLLYQTLKKPSSTV